MKDKVRKMKSKKAQLKIQEMSFMLLALVLFFILAGLFFLVISTGGLQREVQFLEKQKTLSALVSLANTPELSCGRQQCIDADKLLVISERKAFEDFWEVDKLVVRRLPFDGVEVKCNAGNYLSCNTFVLKDEGIDCAVERSYVSLCRKDVKSGFTYDKCELAQVEACVERRT